MSENRKRQRPCCKACFHPGFTRGVAPDGRPSFTCDKCGNWWTYGKDGGEYMGFAMSDRQPSTVSGPKEST